MSDARQTNLQERVVRITYLFNAQAVTITYHKLGEATRLRNHRCPFNEGGRQTNNFGPRQHPEKLIPKFIQNAADGETLPVYGDVSNVREWIYVEDNCRALDLVLREGTVGEVYNIGSRVEKTNLEITKAIIRAVGADNDLIDFVEDRAGHDQRYALDTRKIESLGWEPKYTFEDGLERTVEYYLSDE